jgi:DNA polymerase III alpha subunit
MQSIYQFKCGCSFPIIKESEDGRVPLLDFSWDKAREDCPAVWGLLGRGETKGVFQLESGLGKHWTKRLGPENVDHLGALVSLLRPGCLDAKDENGVSMTEHYIRRRHGEEPVESLHPVLNRLLARTYNVVCFQEESMSVGREVAGFDLALVDRLRRSIGKKVMSEIAAVRDLFLEGAKRTGVVPFEIAQRVWSWIEKSGRYQFCQAHAILYGVRVFKTAYLKAHFPLAFFASWLKTAKFKGQKALDDTRELVNDAKLYDLSVEPPDLRSCRADLHTDGKSTIWFGMSDVKGVGDKRIVELQASLAVAQREAGKPLGDFTWYDCLRRILPHVTASVVKPLISVGAFRWTGVSRQRQLSEYEVLTKLTKPEVAWLVARGGEFDSLEGALARMSVPKKEGGAASTKGRAEALRSRLLLLLNPPAPLTDTPHWVVTTEEKLLGIALSCHRTDTVDMGAVNCTCKEFLAGRSGTLFLGVEIKRAKEHRTRAGKTPGAKMGFLDVADSSGTIEGALCFPDKWKELSGLLTEGGLVVVQAGRSREKDALIIENAWPAGQSQ